MSLRLYVGVTCVEYICYSGIILILSHTGVDQKSILTNIFIFIL